MHRYPTKELVRELLENMPAVKFRTWDRKYNIVNYDIELFTQPPMEYKERRIKQLLEAWDNAASHPNARTEICRALKFMTPDEVASVASIYTHRTYRLTWIILVVSILMLIIGVTTLYLSCYHHDIVTTQPVP